MIEWYAVGAGLASTGLAAFIARQLRVKGYTREALKQIHDQVKTELEAELGLIAQRQLEAERRIEEKELDARLAELQVKNLAEENLATQHLRDEAAAVLLAEQNRADEFEAEKRMILQQELANENQRQDILLSQQREREALAQVALLAEENEAGRIRLAQSEADAVIARALSLQLTEEARLRQEALAAESVKQILDLSLKTQNLKKGLGTKPLVLYMDNLQDIPDLRVESASGAMVGLLVDLGLLVSGPVLVNLASKVVNEYHDRVALRQHSCVDSISYWSCSMSGLRAKMILSLRDKGPYSLMVMPYPNFDKVRWEIALVASGTADPKPRVLASAMGFYDPSKDEAELREIFIKLLSEALDKFNGS